jgi:DNA-binding NtrC family response regulator
MAKSIRKNAAQSAGKPKAASFSTELSLPYLLGGSASQIMSGPGKDSNSSKPVRSAVLLIDDEKPLLDLYAEALGPFFEVTLATSTREAGFLMHKKTFKVVVCDHLMPGGNGLSFLVDAREDYPNTQRVLVTGYMKPEMLLRSVNEAALYRYLLKPVSLPELIKTVQEAAKLYDQSVATVE